MGIFENNCARVDRQRLLALIVEIKAIRARGK